MTDKFVHFIDNLAKESGQYALCEAIKKGYQICCESEDSTTPIKMVHDYELDPSDPAYNRGHGLLIQFKVGDKIEHYLQSDWRDAGNLITNKDLWYGANPTDPRHVAVRNYLIANSKGPLTDDEVRQVIEEKKQKEIREAELAEQKRRKYDNPERFHELLKQFRGEYENACDDLYYGYGFNFWYNDKLKSVLSEDDARIIWHFAFKKMSR